MLKRVIVYIFPFILLCSLFAEQVFPWVVLGSSILFTGLCFIAVLTGLCKREVSILWSWPDLILLFFLIFSFLNLLPTTFFPWGFGRFGCFLTAYFLYKTAGVLDRDQLHKALFIAGTVAALGGVFWFEFLKLRGLVVSVALYALLAIVLSLSQWLQKDSQFYSWQYFSLVFTNFYFLFLTSSKLVAILVLPALIINLIATQKEKRSLVFLRTLGAIITACLVNLPLLLFSSRIGRIGCYFLGLVLSLLLVKKFYLLLRSESLKKRLFRLSIFLSFLLVSGLASFLLTSGWLNSCRAASGFNLFVWGAKLGGKFALLYLAACYLGSLELHFLKRKEIRVASLLILLAAALTITVQSGGILEIYHSVSGSKYLQSGEGMKALAELEKALKFNPYNGQYYFDLALAAELLGEEERAQNYLRNSIEQGYSGREVHVLAGNLYLKQHDFASAEEHYLKVADNEEFLLTRYENLAAVDLAKAQELIKGGERTQAADYLNKIKEIGERMEEICNRGAAAYVSWNRPELSSRMKLIMSKCYYYLRDYEESERWARKAIRDEETRSSAIEIIYFIRDQRLAEN